jgi:hypothetical protein
MRWRRRRAADEATAAAPQLSVVPVPKVERALVALAVHAQQLGDRLDRLERRLDSTIDAAVDAPTHDDVLEVRVHSAKVAAELARVTVELRAEMEARITKLQPKPQPPTARERRIQTTAETILDLSDRLDTMPSDHYRDAATA